MRILGPGEYAQNVVKTGWNALVISSAVVFIGILWLILAAIVLVIRVLG